MSRRNPRPPCAWAFFKLLRELLTPETRAFISIIRSRSAETSAALSLTAPGEGEAGRLEEFPLAPPAAEVAVAAVPTGEDAGGVRVDSRGLACDRTASDFVVSGGLAALRGLGSID